MSWRQIFGGEGRCPDTSLEEEVSSKEPRVEVVKQSKFLEVEILFQCTLNFDDSPKVSLSYGLPVLFGRHTYTERSYGVVDAGCWTSCW